MTINLNVVIKVLSVVRLRSGFTILLHCWESPSNDDRNRRSYVLCIKCWEE